MKAGFTLRLPLGFRTPLVALSLCALPSLASGCGAAGVAVAEDTNRVASELDTCGDLVAKVARIEPKGDPFTHRSGHSVAAVDDKIYVVRGVTDDFDTQENVFPEDVLRFHPSGSAIKEMDQRGDVIPGGLAYSCMAGDSARSGALYLFGGAHYVFELRPDFFSSLVVSSSLFEYDIAGKAWRELHPEGASPSARTGCTAELAGGAMYMFGGINRFFVTNNEMWRFDPEAGTWTNLAPGGAVPQPRYKPLSAIDRKNGLIYYYGGLAVGPTGFARIDDFWVYDIASNTFHQLPTKMTPTRDQGALALLESPDGKKYVVHVGGDLPTETACAGFPQLARATNEVWAFDVSAETWTRLDVVGPMPRIEYHAGATVKNRFYFGGGWAEEPDTVRTCRQEWNESFYELSLAFR